MLSLNALERASQAYRRGYLMGAMGEPFNDCTNAAPGTFAARDYAEGYKAGQNDARPITGRQGTTAPALQNLPLNTPEARRVRDAFRTGGKS